MMKRLWIGFTAVILISFAVLGWIGTRIYQEAPPLPTRVVTFEGVEIIAPGEISQGQNVWQSIGGMELGSIWGHGSYVAPDWTADWLHREAVFMLGEHAQSRYARSFDQLSASEQRELEQMHTDSVRTNTYDASTNTITISPARARAYGANVGYYSTLFLQGNDAYAMPPNVIKDSIRRRQLGAFIFWTAWAASTNRPNDDITYTSNWPSEPLIGNTPTGDAIVWTGVSIILLLAGIGGMAFFYAARRHDERIDDIPENDPLLGTQTTPSQRATVKYFWVVAGLLLLQIVLGVVTAHYGVEGNAFYGIPIADFLPYSLARTWHTQLGIFWIATAWLAAGLYIGPAVGGLEPKGQRLGVNVLFGALLVVVLGSMAGEWLSVMQHMTDDTVWFYFGHSGYEYIDLGRAFQIALFIGLCLWLFLMVRALRPALKRHDSQRPILILFTIASAAITIFYASALVYGEHTNLAIVEYWRWWVVHLWVEGFFEVFATVVIAFLFARLKLVRLETAGYSAILSSTIFLSGGIIGTLHHLYFSGTPTVVLALGSVFSALEVVPLCFVGFEAWENYKLSRLRPWVQKYKWPIYYFISVAFWNLVGAGLFGFMINPPIALYYMQGLNTTPVHGHAALFGVYGMLGIGLMLFALRSMKPEQQWSEGINKFSFWTINVGLLAMICLSLLPLGLRQTWASVEFGYWYARSSEFMQEPIMNTLRWLRVPGDTVFAIGAIVLAVFIGLITMRPRKAG
jgi:nitric oxide reductase subunit B